MHLSLMAVTPNLLSMILGAFITGLKKLGSTGKQRFENTIKVWRGVLATEHNFHLFTFLSEQREKLD